LQISILAPTADTAQARLIIDRSTAHRIGNYPTPALAMSSRDFTLCASQENQPMSEQTVKDLSERLALFARARDWEQFHSPKNLAMALAGESGELLEHFQWLTEAQSRSLDDEKKQAVAMEMADIFIYLLRLAERMDIDLLQSAYRKMAINESRYPADKVRGDARRAEEYD
jgi:dCTP diphosphatase